MLVHERVSVQIMLWLSPRLPNPVSAINQHDGREIAGTDDPTTLLPRGVFLGNRSLTDQVERAVVRAYRREIVLAEERAAPTFAEATLLSLRTS